MDFLGIYTIIQNTENYVEFLQNLGYKFRKEEFLDFSELIDLILETNCMSYYELVEYTENFTFGYEIPRIGEEFDLIRLGKNYNINIEIKNSSTEVRKRKQMENNAYYLEALKNPTLYYSFDVEERSILFGDWVDGILHFRYIELDELIERIKDQKVDYSTEIKNVLTSEKFLVNPFTDTDLFLGNKYFLNAHQLNIFNEIIDNISTDIFSPVSIEGSAGTGKTLLLYTLADYLADSENIIIHSGNLNNGHNVLNDHNFNIFPAKEIKDIDFSNIQFIFIDEAQRTYIEQLNLLFDQSDKYNIKILFFFDPKQTFFDNEKGYKNKDMINNYTKERKGQIFKLSTRVRSNFQIVKFINQIFEFNINNTKVIDNSNQKIIIKYYNSYNDFLAHEEKIYFSEYILLGYASSKFKKDKYYKYSSYGIPHGVVGQEFDNIAVIIDENFYYEVNQTETTFRLKSSNDNSYYSGERMLYNNLTRAREKLFIAVIDNPDVYGKLLSFVSTM